MTKRRDWYEKENDRLEKLLPERARVPHPHAELVPVLEREVGAPLRAPRAHELPPRTITRDVSFVDLRIRRAHLTCGHVREYKSRSNPPVWMVCRVCTHNQHERTKAWRLEKALERARKGLEAKEAPVVLAEPAADAPPRPEEPLGPGWTNSEKPSLLVTLGFAGSPEKP